ncbi:MAG: RsmD family RNA methyltransferase [Alphaproteobacteria bacterium]|jgi:16S rRNA (guanine966-N2)-methyltransferase|nr:RsmD family RNA methyltransferase [Alphaproteobacteria bacterium]
MEKNIKVGSGFLRGKKLFSPSAEITRPNSQRAREALFNVLRGGKFADLPFEKMVDCFGGSGVVSIEALSQNVAKKAVCVEMDRNAYKVVKTNFDSCSEQLEDGSYSYVNADVVSEIANHSDADLLYCDPPYSSDVLAKLVNKVCSMDWKKSEDLLIVVSTDSLEYAKTGRKELLEKNFRILDERKYGKNLLVFCKLK